MSLHTLRGAETECGGSREGLLSPEGTSDYVKILLSPLASALAHRRASFLISCSTHVAKGLPPSNTQRLRCFHSIQAVRIAREPKPFWKHRGAALVDHSHHAKKSESSVGGAVVKRHKARTSCQTCRERGQPTRRCWIVSRL